MASRDSAFRISVDLAGLIPLGAPLNEAIFPHLSRAVEKIVHAAGETWTEFASGQPMPNGKVLSRRSGVYAQSIHLEMTGPFSGRVWNDAPHAKAIEEGTPAHDMKEMLWSSLKTRISAKGLRYLIIPFRWDHPKSVISNRRMPVDVWNWWHKEEDRAASHTTGTHKRLSGTGAYDIKTRERLTTPAWTYSWGKRISKTDLEDMGFGANDKYAKRLAGMVNFRVPGKKGGASHSQYLTFRVMSEKSKGWLAPAVEGKWPARQVQEMYQPIAEELFTRAVEFDVRAWVASVGGS